VQTVFWPELVKEEGGLGLYGGIELNGFKETGSVSLY
jgi:hypothetical protein